MVCLPPGTLGTKMLSIQSFPTRPSPAVGPLKPVSTSMPHTNQDPLAAWLQGGCGVDEDRWSDSSGIEQLQQKREKRQRQEHIRRGVRSNHIANVQGSCELEQWQQCDACWAWVNLGLKGAATTTTTCQGCGQQAGSSNLTVHSDISNDFGCNFVFSWSRLSSLFPSCNCPAMISGDSDRLQWNVSFMLLQEVTEQDIKLLQDVLHRIGMYLHAHHCSMKLERG